MVRQELESFGQGLVRGLRSSPLRIQVEMIMTRRLPSTMMKLFCLLKSLYLRAVEAQAQEVKGQTQALCE